MTSQDMDASGPMSALYFHSNCTLRLEEEYLRGSFLCLLFAPPYSEPCSDSAAHVPSNGGRKEQLTVSNMA